MSNKSIAVALNAKKVVELLIKKEYSLSTAESCTGGLIGKLFTDIPGSSQFYQGGIIAYHNDVKMALLGVSEQTLDSFGAVSFQCAEEMVNGVTKVLKTRCGIAVTGIAGPSGGSNQKPVGLVYIGTAVNDSVRVEKHIFSGNRDQVRKLTADTAISMLLNHLLDS